MLPDRPRRLNKDASFDSMTYTTSCEAYEALGELIRRYNFSAAAIVEWSTRSISLNLEVRLEKTVAIEGDRIPIQVGYGKLFCKAT